jgi:phosphatidate cytidylyltransferase
MQRRGFQPATALGLVLGGLTLAAAYLRGEPGMLFFLALGVVASLLWYMAVPAKAREGAAGNVGATVFGIAYVPFLGGFVLIILGLANSGRALMLAVLGLTILYDIVAFAGGSLYGTTPLAPTISPKKSWQGLVIASFATFIVGVALVPLAVDLLTIWRAIGLTLVVLVFAPLGDLAESMFKRDQGVKDSGVFLPGHGGALDRIDSILFVAPAAFYLFRLIF